MTFRHWLCKVIDLWHDWKPMATHPTVSGCTTFGTPREWKNYCKLTRCHGNGTHLWLNNWLDIGWQWDRAMNNVLNLEECHLWRSGREWIDFSCAGIYILFLLRSKCNYVIQFRDVMHSFLHRCTVNKKLISQEDETLGLSLLCPIRCWPWTFTFFHRDDVITQTNHVKATNKM